MHNYTNLELSAQFCLHHLPLSIICYLQRSLFPFVCVAVSDSTINWQGHQCTILYNGFANCPGNSSSGKITRSSTAKENMNLKDSCMCCFIHTSIMGQLEKTFIISTKLLLVQAVVLSNIFRSASSLADEYSRL